MKYIIVLFLILLVSCEPSTEERLKQRREAYRVMNSANTKLEDSTDIDYREVLSRFQNIPVQDSKKRLEFAKQWDQRVNSIIDSLRAIGVPTPVISNLAKCDTFKDGYKGILWSWSPDKLINFYKVRYFILRDQYNSKISDGRSALNIHFRKGTYRDYRSDKPMRERSFSFLNNKLYGIEFYNYISWNYNFQMALDAAEEIAKEYNLPKMIDQIVGGGISNTVWYSDCPDYMVNVAIFWDPNIIDGEANRYISVRIVNLDKDNESNEIHGIARSEKRKKQITKLTEDF